MTSYHWSTIGLGVLQTPHNFYQMKHPRKAETTTDDPRTTSLVPWILAGSWRLIDERSEPGSSSMCLLLWILKLGCANLRGVGKNMNPKICLLIIPNCDFSWWFTMVQFVKKVPKNKQIQVWIGGEGLSIRKGAGSPLFHDSPKISSVVFLPGSP